MNKTSRLVFLDALRGFALLTITVNHVTGITTRMGREGLGFPTLTQFGYSSAAEIFIMISGFLFGLLNFTKSDQQVLMNSVNRAAKLYLFNIALVASLLLIVVNSNSDIGEKTGFFYVTRMIDPKSLFGPFSLTAAPYLAGILMLYIYLIAIATVFRLVFRKRSYMIFASVALYAVSLIVPYSFPYLPKIEFDIFAWQLLFVIPAALGQGASIDLVRDLFRRPKTIVVSCWAIIAAIAIVRVLEVRGAISLAGYEWLVDKDDLGPLRAVHAVVVLIALSLTIEYLLNRFPAIVRPFSLIGSVALEAFCASVLATYFVGSLWPTLNGNVGYIVLQAIAVSLVSLFGLALAMWRMTMKELRTRPILNTGAN